MQQQSSDTTDNTLEWFTQNLPPDYLNHPEYFLYSTALDVQQMQDIPENRRRFKQVLVERQVGEGVELPEIDQKQIDDFMNPNDKDLRLLRSEKLVELTSMRLQQTQDLALSQRLAALELFHKEAPFRKGKMDESYFRNRELVESDLRGFLEHARGGSLIDLTTKNPKSEISILAKSGEKVRWRTYLNRASGVLLGTKWGLKGKKSDNPHRRSDALKTLLKITGINISECIPMDEKYFNNPEIVKADLTAYFRQAKGNYLADLNTRNPSRNTIIITQSGKHVKWETYLSRASGILLGTKGGKKSDKLHRKSDVLDRLRELCGVIIMDEKYFNSPAYVKADLVAYLQHAKGDSLKDLHTNNPKSSISITTQSGETVKWQAYLDRASGVLLGTKSGNKSNYPSRPVDALGQLKELCDVLVMNKEYFNNPAYVKADLIAYIRQAKGDSLTDLSTSNPSKSTSITTQSGETIKWQVYLNRASTVFFGTKQSTRTKKSDNPHRLVDALKKLIQIANQSQSSVRPNSQSSTNE